MAVEVETGKKLKVLHTDPRGGEFMSVEFSEDFTEHDIERLLTTPYTPQQNGVVGRQN
jgi:transposase InsO family protein